MSDWIKRTVWKKATTTRNDNFTNMLSLSLHFPWETMKSLSLSDTENLYFISLMFVHMLRVVSQRCQVLRIEVSTAWQATNRRTRDVSTVTAMSQRWNTKSTSITFQNSKWRKFRESCSIVSEVSSRYAWKVYLLKVCDLIIAWKVHL